MYMRITKNNISIPTARMVSSNTNNVMANKITPNAMSNKMGSFIAFLMLTVYKAPVGLLCDIFEDFFALTI